MFCTNCGAQLPDGTQFCTQCGMSVKDASQSESATAPAPAPVPEPTPTPAPAPASSVAPAAATPASASKRKGVWIAVIIVAAVIIVGALIMLLANPFATSADSNKEAPEATTQQDSSAKEADEQASQPDEVISRFYNGGIHIAMPAKFASEGYEWSDKVNGIPRLCNKDGIVAAQIVLPKQMITYDEARAERYGLGFVERGDEKTPVNLTVLYWQDGNQGLGVVHGSQPRSVGAPSVDFMGITLEELASWISLEHQGEYVPAQIGDFIDMQESSSSNSSSSSSGSSSSSSSNNSASSADSLVAGHQPFYGVWIGAFEDRDNADRFNTAARGAGLESFMFLSSDWTNLNQKHYWVVAGAVASTEAEANALLPTVQSKGYGNAYVKYSGTYKG